MTEYTYYGDADEQPVLDTTVLDLSEEHTDIVRAAVANNPIAVRAAHVFERKGFFDRDDFASNPSPSCRGSNPDIVVQVTVVIRHEHSADRNGDYAALNGIYVNMQEKKIVAEIEAQQAAVAAHREEIAHAEANLAAAQARLDSMQQG